VRGPDKPRPSAAAILEAFGEAIEWNDLQGIIDGFFDTRNDAQDQRRYFLNAAADVADAWFFERDLQGIFDPDAVLADRDVIALGFDGSRKRSRGVTDATALIAFRLRDRCLFEIRIWEQPDGPEGEKWEIPRLEVDAEVRQAFRRFTVVAFYADPAKWEETVGRWEVEYGPRLKKKATREHPIQWWMTGARNRVVVAALKLFGEAVFEKTVKHNGARPHGAAPAERAPAVDPQGGGHRDEGSTRTPRRRSTASSLRCSHTPPAWTRSRPA
jgi:hypothetical protein